MEIKKKTQIKNAFDSVLRADYLSLDDFDELENLSNYFVDFFILSNQIKLSDYFSNLNFHHVYLWLYCFSFQL